MPTFGKVKRKYENDADRDLAWRWQLACELVEQEARPTPSQAPSWAALTTIAAYGTAGQAMLRKIKLVPTGLRQAHHIYQSEALGCYIEAKLIAGDGPQAIAKRAQLSAEVVRWYRWSFCDVREAQNDADRLARHLSRHEDDDSSAIAMIRWILGYAALTRPSVDVDLIAVDWLGLSEPSWPAGSRIDQALSMRDELIASRRNDDRWAHTLLKLIQKARKQHWPVGVATTDARRRRQAVILDVLSGRYDSSRPSEQIAA
jgi:hypothetical protein